MQAVIAILAALVARAKTGVGEYLDVAVADGMLALMSLQMDDVLATGAEQAPGAAPLSGRFACYDTYRCADDGWVAVAAIEEKFWANLCRLLGLENLVDQQYVESAQPSVRAALASAFLTKARDDWATLLAPADTCVSPVLTSTEAANDRAFAERKAFATARSPAGDTWPQLAPMLAGAVRDDSYDLPDRAVTDTDAVLTAAGFTGDEIARLRNEGIVG
jgi:crotonobetainyl-CoA:carnitine CoA-transferase CaiB-like acyl-CoA transferase